MSNIVQSEPVAEDPVGYQHKRRRASRFLLTGVMMIAFGVLMIRLEQFKADQILDVSIFKVTALVIGFVGLVLIFSGLTLLPKVKLPPDNIIR